MPRAIADPSQMALKSTNKPAKRSAAAVPYRYSLEDRPTRTGSVLTASGSVLSVLRADLQQRRSKCSSFVSDEQTFKETSVFQNKDEQLRAAATILFSSAICGIAPPILN
jgi:hypothetical protein